MTKTKILIVEDEPMISELLGVMLGHFGYDVVDIVSSGEAAIQATVTSSPNLVLMDINLSGQLDGIQAATYISSIFSVPVVFMTGSTDSETISRAKAAEPFGFQPKPFRPLELKNTIEKALTAFNAHESQEGLIDWDIPRMMQVQEGIVVTSMDNHVLFLNPCAEDLTEWSRDQAMFRPLGDILTMNENVEADLLSGLLCGGYSEVTDRQTTLVSRSGKKWKVTMNVHPIRNRAGRIVSMFTHVKSGMNGTTPTIS